MGEPFAVMSLKEGDHMHKFKKVSAALFSTGILAAGIAAPSAGGDLPVAYAPQIGG